MQSKSLCAMVAIQLSLQLGLGIGVGLAASPVIGTATGNGAFRVDHAMVRGNATLFEGSTLETSGAGSSVELSSGGRVSLEAASRGRVFGNRMVLEQGQGTLERAPGADPSLLNLEALGLTIQSAGATGRARVAVEDNRVYVASMTGAFRVLNANGQLVANLPHGMTLAFEPQAGATSASQVTGCLQNQSGHYILTDEVTNVTVEVSGAGLDRETGNRVELIGSVDGSAAAAEGASELVRVTQVRRLARGCGEGGGGVAVAAGAGGAAAGAAAAAAGGATAATVAVVGGVAAAATVGGLAAADKLPGQGDEEGDPAPISR